MRIILFVAILFSYVPVFSQSNNINIVSDPRVQTLVERHVTYGKHVKGIYGYRIQIFFDSGNNARKKANDIKLDFTSKYPGIGAYLVFHEPHFKVRVGDFRNRFEAEYYKKLFETDFKNIFIVRDIMTPPPIHPTEY